MWPHTCMYIYTNMGWEITAVLVQILPSLGRPFYQEATLVSNNRIKEWKNRQELLLTVMRAL